MVVVTPRARYHFTLKQQRRMAEIGIPADTVQHFTFEGSVRLFDAGVFGSSLLRTYCTNERAEAAAYSRGSTQGPEPYRAVP